MREILDNTLFLNSYASFYLSSQDVIPFHRFYFKNRAGIGILFLNPSISFASGYPVTHVTQQR